VEVVVVASLRQTRLLGDCTDKSPPATELLFTASSSSGWEGDRDAALLVPPLRVSTSELELSAVTTSSLMLGLVVTSSLLELAGSETAASCGRG
jgi:hypothetical protein